MVSVWQCLPDGIDVVGEGRGRGRQSRCSPSEKSYFGISLRGPDKSQLGAAGTPSAPSRSGGLNGSASAHHPEQPGDYGDDEQDDANP